MKLHAEVESLGTQLEEAENRWMELQEELS